MAVRPVPPAALAALQQAAERIIAQCPAPNSELWGRHMGEASAEIAVKYRLGRNRGMRLGVQVFREALEAHEQRAARRSS
jgi:hypothetical protein